MNAKVIIGSVVVILLGVVGGWYVVTSGDVPVEESLSEGARQAGREADAASAEAVLALTFTDLAGTEVSLEEFAGQPLVVNAWATWCPFCVKELPDFAAVQEEFGDAVTIIAIDRGEAAAVARDYVTGLGVGDDLIYLLDPDDSFYGAIGGRFMPETLFITADGTIDFHKRGPMDLDEIRRRVAELIG